MATTYSLLSPSYLFCLSIDRKASIHTPYSLYIVPIILFFLLGLGEAGGGH
jgi:hypothetical protein